MEVLIKLEGTYALLICLPADMLFICSNVF